MTSITIGTRIEALERTVDTAHSRDTVRKALYDVLLDGIDFGPRDLPRPEDRAWLHDAVALPLKEATDVALHALIWNVAETFERAPKQIREHFDQSHEGEDLGWE